jgi:hypothetical protein
MILSCAVTRFFDCVKTRFSDIMLDVEGTDYFGLSNAYHASMSLRA